MLNTIIKTAGCFRPLQENLDCEFASLQRQQTPKRKVWWKDFSIRGRTLSPPRNEVNIVLEKFTLQPRAPFFNHFRSQTAKIVPHLLCLRRRHLSELMAYFGALTLSTPRSETAIYQISPAASHRYIPAHLYTLLPILAASHRLES